MDVVVRAGCGDLRGVVEGGVGVFRGVPFALPPVGALRFAGPVRVARWEGVRDAVGFGAVPPQAADFGMDGMFGAGDDWLNLNVWTPDTGGRLPVLVWVHGGAYCVGASGVPEYDGGRLARGGVVVVTFNYRVGMEGFGAIEGAVANRGLLDQVAALEWVRDNIGAFGGDPDRVTVFGQSAGGGSVAALLATGRAKGLFRRAIAQSVQGTFFAPELAADIAEACAGELGLRATVDDLAGVEPELLAAAGDEVAAAMSARVGRWGPPAQRTIPFSPIIDGDVLTATPWEALAGGAGLGIDLLAGHTRDEHRLFSALEGLIGGVTEEQTAAALEIFAPGPYPAADPEALFETVHGDWAFRMPTLHLATAQAAAGGDAHFYELTWADGPLGACHGLDVPLVFGNLTAGRTAALIADPAAAVPVSAAMRAAWISFAATGDPGWPAFDPGRRLTRIFDTVPATVPYPEEASRRVWERHSFAAHRLLRE